MGVSSRPKDNPLHPWTPVKAFRRRKLLIFTAISAILVCLLFLTFSTYTKVLLMAPNVLSHLVLNGCMVMSALLAIGLSIGAIRYYRHFHALSLVLSSYHMTIRVDDPQRMSIMVEEAIGSAGMFPLPVCGPDSPRAGGRMLPRGIQGMFRIRESDLTFIIHSSAVQEDGRFINDVILGPVRQDNLADAVLLVRSVESLKPEEGPGSIPNRSL
jgi:hypothetical protein